MKPSTEVAQFSSSAARRSEATHSHTFMDEKYELIWFYMRPEPRPCFTPQLLREARLFHHDLVTRIDSDESLSVKYLVLASSVANTFNLGGDLETFAKWIKARDRETLSTYAKTCADMAYRVATGLDRRVTTIALVQGDALGGGFEAALSGNVLIAERSATFGLPEILFNLFPGMGAYQLLSRKVGPSLAERIIVSGKLYSAEELYEMGIVDILVADGQGDKAVYDYIKKTNRRANSYRALRAVKEYCNPLDYKELIHVTDIWIDAALSLKEADLRMMERLATKQTKRSAEAA